MQKIANYIAGKLLPPASGEYIDNIDPAIGKVYSHTPDSDERDIGQAVQAARRAFPVWSAKTAGQRAAYLYRLSSLIDANIEKLALAESVDNGKPLALALAVDIPRASQNFHFFASAIEQFASESHATSERVLNYTLRKPIGIAGCISPWNLPLYLFSWKIAPALAAGNCVIAKPSEITPMTAFLLSELCIEAGFPGGVLNIVHGLGHKVGAAITAHSDIGVISFTGGTRTGAEIARTTAPTFKKVSLELGGKNPTLIFADCQYDDMLDTTLRSSFTNQGQICLCGSRIFVERAVYAKFKQDFVARTRELTVCDPLEPESRLGAVVSQQHIEKILSYIELAKEEGGTILCGGERVQLTGRCKNGFFVAPTVIEGLDAHCRTNQEEIFGPVVTIMPFEGEDEALKLANSTEYGLAATVWTENLSRAHRLGSELQAGVVWVNCWLLRDLRTPFGGTKSSGVGREGGDEALRFFTEPKNVCIKF